MEERVADFLLWERTCVFVCVRVISTPDVCQPRQHNNHQWHFRISFGNSQLDHAAHILSRVSQLPVQSACPSGWTPKQLTRFSCAESWHAFAPVMVSHP